MTRIKGVNTNLHRALSLADSKKSECKCIYHGTLFFEYEVDDVGLKCFQEAKQSYEVVK